MLEFRIPIAQFVSAAVIGVCFIVALLVLNLWIEGRSRILGVLGATLVLLSTLTQYFNGSLAGAYGRDTALYAAGSVTAALLAAAGLVLLATAVARAFRAQQPHGDH
jgi:hypothetical protein